MGNLIDHSMNAVAPGCVLQKCGAIQQAFEIHRRALADQLKLETEGLIDSFVAGKGKDLKIMLRAVDAQAEVRSISGVQHHRDHRV